MNFRRNLRYKYFEHVTEIMYIWSRSLIFIMGRFNIFFLLVWIKTLGKNNGLFSSH